MRDAIKNTAACVACAAMIGYPFALYLLGYPR
jgi:hypothetical protein